MAKKVRAQVSNLRHRLDIQISYVERVVFDEIAAGFDLVAHQHGENFVGFNRRYAASLAYLITGTVRVFRLGT